MRIVICRGDLPPNEGWKAKGYPRENCWEPEELVEAGAKNQRILPEARRVFWECYWRLLGRYKGGRPFFEVYILDGGPPLTLTKDQVCRFVVAAGMSSSALVPEDVKRTLLKVYSRYRVRNES
ncbi:MAG: hypothetical protein QXJ59_05280 [Thermofilaceae archaeon]